MSQVINEQNRNTSLWEREIQLLNFYGLQIGDECSLFDFPVQYKQQKYTIHTFCGGCTQGKEIMLLIHGYGGSNVHYARMYKQLIQKYQIYSIDLPGMGFSSKDNSNLYTYEETLDYFIGIISKFIEDLFGQQKIILVGHSFGGFIVAHLLTRLPNQISQVFFLSPAGATYYDENEIASLQDPNNYCFLTRGFLNFVRSKWNQQIIPQQIPSTFFGKQWLKMYLWGRMKIRGNEYNLWKQYVDEMISLPEGSERALYILLQFPRVSARGFDSIEYLITKQSLILQNTPIHFYFGNKDWMDNQGAFRLQSRFNNVKVQIIQQAGHQLNFENPQAVISQMQNDINIRLQSQ